MAENSPKSMEQRTADLRSSVNKKQDKCQKQNTHTACTTSPGISYLNCRKPETENLERSWGGRGHGGNLTCKEQGKELQYASQKSFKQEVEWNTESVENNANLEFYI